MRGTFGFDGSEFYLFVEVQGVQVDSFRSRNKGEAFAKYRQLESCGVVSWNILNVCLG